MDLLRTFLLSMIIESGTLNREVNVIQDCIRLHVTVFLAYNRG